MLLAMKKTIAALVIATVAGQTVPAPPCDMMHVAVPAGEHAHHSSGQAPDDHEHAPPTPPCVCPAVCQWSVVAPISSVAVRKLSQPPSINVVVAARTAVSPPFASLDHVLPISLAPPLQA
jgi:hypothetical protein